MKRHLFSLLVLAISMWLPALAHAGTCNASYPDTLPMTSGSVGALPPDLPGQVSPGNITTITGVGSGISFTYTPTSGSPTTSTLSVGTASGVNCTGTWTGARFWKGYWQAGPGMSAKLVINNSSTQFIDCTGLQPGDAAAINGATFSGTDGVSKVWAGPGPQDWHFAGYDTPTGKIRDVRHRLDGTCRVGPSQTTPSFSAPSGGVNTNNLLHLTAAGSGGILSIEFFVDGISKGIDSGSPWDLQVNGLSLGKHDIQVKANFAQGFALASSTFIYSPTKVSVGNNFACAQVNNGRGKCWGLNNNGQLGAGSSATNSAIPLDVVDGFLTMGGITEISAGHEGACAATFGGVKCWGKNTNGLLGVSPGSLASSNTPITVISTGSGVTSVSVGGRHACALFSNGDVKCWGGGQYGQLGNGSYTASVTTPTLMATGAGKVTTGLYGTYVMIGADLWATGDDVYGQVGNGTPLAKVNTKVKIITGGVVDVVAGTWHICARVFSGIQCWGNNYFGEVGIGTTSAAVSTPTWAHEWDAWSVDQMALGDSTTCATLGSGLAKCLGYNAFGQLGVNYTSTSELHPLTPNSYSAGVVQIDGGISNICAFDSGHIKCAGDNTEDQIGNPSPLVGNPQLWPFTVEGL